MDYSLEIENLSKTYDTFKLEDINFKLPSGSIMGLIGENGAGKTTTLKLILNLIKRNEGTIKIFGKDNIENEREIKEQIGIVLDESYFHDTLKASDICLIMKNIYKNWDTDIYNNYLNKFNLHKNKILKEYSRGMKMKLSLAVALSHNPQFLILDEATSGLDPIVRNEILDVFLEFIQDEQHSILVSSHITSDLEKIADYVTFIHDGKIVFSKSKDDLIYNYGLIKCSINDINKIGEADIIARRKNQFGYEILISDKKEMQKKYKDFIIDNTAIEDIMLFYIKGDKI